MLMRARMRRRDEDGSSLIVVVLVSALVLTLTTLALATGDHANRSSVRDANWDVALGVAEAGVDQAVAKIEAAGGIAPVPFTGSTPQGSYAVDVAAAPTGFVITSSGRSGTTSLERERTLRVTLSPPAVFPYALFSDTSIELKNNDTISGDVWANDSVLFRQNGVLDGSITAAQSWVRLEGGSHVTGNVWTGGFNPSGSWALKLEGGAEIDGWAKASASQPADPNTCGGEAQANYQVPLDSGAIIHGGLTTWGEKTGPGTAASPYQSHTCTEAAVPKPIPPYRYNAANYDSPQEFGSVASFQTWLATNKTALEGVFYVAEGAPSQSNRIDLTGATVVGDTLIVTDAPVFTNGIDDDESSEQVFVVVSHYEPPVGSACDVNHDSSECAIHVKNNFDSSCATAVLLYADRGPVAVKNNQSMCGAIYAESILVKNNQALTWDPRIAGVVGFGDATYEVTLWEEVPS